MNAKIRKRVACHGASDYMLRAIKKVAAESSESLVDTDRNIIPVFKPDVIIDACRAVQRFRKYCDKHNTYLLATRHGVANKYNGPDDEFRWADYICGSEWDRENYLEHNVVPQRGFLLTGNPWNDDVFNIPDREVNENCPTFLFAPTWNEEVSASFYFDDRLPSLISQVFPEFKLIIKPHPAIIQAGNYVRGAIAARPIFGVSDQYIEKSQRLLDIWRRQAAQSENVLFVEDAEANISDFYAETDILISDGSSLIWEFMVLERPIMLYDSKVFPQIMTMRKSDQAFANARRNVGFDFSSDKEFVSVLRNVFDEHRSHKVHVQRENVQDVYGRYTDGKSVQRLIEAVEALPKTKVLFVLPEGGAEPESIREKYVSHYANVELHFVEERSFWQNDGVCGADDLGIEHAHRVVVTNIDKDCDLFSHCYIGEFARKTPQGGVSGFCARKLNATVSDRMDVVQDYAESVVEENGWDNIDMHVLDGSECFEDQRFFLCFNVDGCGKETFGQFLQAAGLFADHLKSTPYAKEVHGSRGESKYVVQDISSASADRDLSEEALTLSDVLLSASSDCEKFMREFDVYSQVLGRLMMQYRNFNPETCVQSLQRLLDKLPTFTPAILFLVDLLAVADRGGPATELLLSCLEQSDEDKHLLQKLHQTLAQCRYDQFCMPQEGDRNFPYPFGFLDHPKVGKVVSGFFHVSGWTTCTERMADRMFLTINGKPVFEQCPFKRDDVANKFGERFTSDDRPGFIWLCDPETLQANTCHVLELNVIKDSKVYCVGRRTLFVRG